MIYIYKIYFPVSNKYYIGQTDNLEERLFNHIKSKYLIGYALNKYDDWQISVLHICSSKEEANKLEIEEIKNHNSQVPNGYNLTSGGEGLFNPCEDIRKKMSEAKKGNKNTLGFHHTEETKRKISKGLKGVKKWSGKHHTEKTKKKMSEVKKGNKYGLGNKSRLGKCHFEITKLKMKISQLKRRIKEQEIKL